MKLRSVCVAYNQNNCWLIKDALDPHLSEYICIEDCQFCNEAYGVDISVGRIQIKQIMKPSIFLSAVTLTVVAGDFYSSRYDNFDIQPLLSNDRILLSFTKCFLDRGPCTPDAKDFKKVIPEALETTCGKCTPKQKDLIRKVVRAVMERHPDSWKELVEKYDKDMKYRDSFDRFLEESI